MRRVLVLVALTTAGAAGGLAWAGSAAAGGGGGGGGCHEMTEGSGSAVDLAGFCFAPSLLRVAPGTEVTWTNRDPADHVVAGTGWVLQTTLAAGATGAHRFDDPGIYPYTCYLHPGMNGVVLVGEDAGAADPAAGPDDAALTEPIVAVGAGEADGDGTQPLAAAAVGAGAGLAAGLLGARRWPRRRLA